MTSDDPQGLAIKEAMSRIAYFLKEDFHAYFTQVLPSLLLDSQQKIDIKMTSADEAGGEGFTLKLKGFEGEQRISMNTSALESKVAAFKLLQQISENLGSAFTPFCETVLPVALGDLTYPYSKAIRKSAMKICVNVLSAVGEPLNVTVFA